VTQFGFNGGYYFISLSARLYDQDSQD
jgi:hypothetical protein